MSHSVALVRRAISDRSFWKEAGRQLVLYDPCQDAAQALISSYRSGESCGYVIAYLLGQIRHPAGYETALEILEADEQQLSESYAAAALVRIDSERALVDLMDVLQKTQNGAVRRGVVAGLGAIGSEAAKKALVGAVSDGLLREKTAAWELTKFDVPEAELGSWLRGDPRLARLAIEILAERARKRPQPLLPGRAIREVVFEVAERVCVLEGPTRLIREWFRDLPSRAESMVVASMTGEVDDLYLDPLDRLIHESVYHFAPGWPPEDAVDGLEPSFCRCERGEVVIGGTCVVISHDYWTPFFANLRASPELDRLVELTVKVGVIDRETGEMARRPDDFSMRDDAERVIWCHVVERTQQTSAAWTRSVQECEDCGEMVFADATSLGLCPYCADIGCAHRFVDSRCVHCFARECSL